MNLTTLPNLLDAVSAPVGWAVVHSLWQGVGIAALYGCARLLVVSTPRARYALAAFALATLVTLPLVTALNHTAAGSAVSDNSLIAAAPRPSTTTPAIAPSHSAPAAVFNPTQPWLDRADVERWAPAISRTWLLGVALFSVFHLAGLRGASRLRRHGTKAAAPRWAEAMERLAERLGVRRAVTLLESSTAQVPLVVGWLKPAIIVPAAALAGLPAAQIEALLAHELAHIRRQDFLVNLLQALAETLFFYHPAAWWLSRQMRHERELCCDDLAVEACGNRRTYARALAGLAELHVGSTGLALAADGGDPGSLRHRIERLWDRQNPRQPTVWLVGVAAIALAVGGLAVAMPAPADDPLTLPANSFSNLAAMPVMASLSGFNATPSPAGATRMSRNVRHAIAPTDGKWTWAGFIEGDRVELSLKRSADRHRSHNSFSVALADLSGDLGSSFSLRRDAGSLNFSGGFRSQDGERSGAGTVSFTADATFVDRMKKLGWKVDEDELFAAVLFDVTTKWAAELSSLGYGPKALDWDELLGWRIHDVLPEWIRGLAASGYSGLDADTVLAWKIHDVDLRDIEEFRSILGQKPSPDEIVALTIHGVTPEIAKKQIAVFGSLDADELVGLTIHGVDAAQLEKFKALGLGTIDSDDAMALAIHGVDADDIAEMRRAGWKIDDVDAAVALKIHGVNPAYAAELATAGLGDLDPEMLVAFKIHGITPEWVRGMEQLGLGQLDADELVGLRIHDVTPDFVEGFRREKISGLTADAVTAFAIHGVDLETVKELRKRGFDSLDADDLVDYAIHGRRWEQRR